MVAQFTIQRHFQDGDDRQTARGWHLAKQEGGFLVIKDDVYTSDHEGLTLRLADVDELIRDLQTLKGMT